jgi:hypothetical protein
MVLQAVGWDLLVGARVAHHIHRIKAILHSLEASGKMGELRSRLPCSLVDPVNPAER